MSDGLGTLGMVNYPYATDFVAPLPANPIIAACNAAKNVPKFESEKVQDSNPSMFNYTNIEAL